MEEIEIYRKAVEHFGISNQVKMAIEECGELIVSLSHIRRRKDTIFGVAAEVADVEIMCGQLRVMLTDNIVEKVKKKKLRRLELLMGEK